MQQFYKIIKNNYEKIIDKDIKLKTSIKKNSVQIVKDENKKCTEKKEICIDKGKFLSMDTIEGINDDYVDMIQYDVNTQLNKIFLLSKDNKSFINDNQIVFLLKIINIVIKSIKDMFSEISEQHFDLFFFGSDAKKTFPCKNHKITENNVNSADTTFYSDGEIIIRLYRKEELIKVTIHEVLHVLKVETRLKENFKKMFNVSVNLLTNEAIVEAIATFINCTLYSLINNEDINIVLNKEINMGQLQTAKILNHFDFKSVKDFLETFHYIIEDIYFNLNNYEDLEIEINEKNIALVAGHYGIDYFEEFILEDYKNFNEFCLNKDKYIKDLLMPAKIDSYNELYEYLEELTDKKRITILTQFLKILLEK